MKVCEKICTWKNEDNPHHLNMYFKKKIVEHHMKIREAASGHQELVAPWLMTSSIQINVQNSFLSNLA